MKSFKKLLASALLVGVSGTLLAQPGAPGAGDSGADVVKGAKAAVLSPAEMAERAAQLGAQSQDNLRATLELRLVARKDKDIIRLNCVNDKLLQMKALMNTLEIANEDLKSAVGAQDQEALVHHYTQVTLSAENIKSLRQEANGCAGESSSYTGANTIEVTGPHIPDDPTSDPFGSGESEPPAYASPFN
jgi:hypothetical protein